MEKFDYVKEMNRLRKNRKKFTPREVDGLTAAPDVAVEDVEVVESEYVGNLVVFAFVVFLILLVLKGTMQ